MVSSGVSRHGQARPERSVVRRRRIVAAATATPTTALRNCSLQRQESAGFADISAMQIDGRPGAATANS
jgi:hypothetical protein